MKTIALLLSLVLPLVAGAATNPKFVTLQNWKVPVSPDAQVVLGHRPNGRVAYVSVGKEKFVMVSKSFRAQSIRSIKVRIQELKGDPASLKIQPRQHEGSVFAFSSGDAIHWFSTNGGHLVVTAPPEKLTALRDALIGKVVAR